MSDHTKSESGNNIMTTKILSSVLDNDNKETRGGGPPEPRDPESVVSEHDALSILCNHARRALVNDPHPNAQHYRSVMT